jgi:hypothetical protein
MDRHGGYVLLGTGIGAAGTLPEHILKDSTNGTKPDISQLNLLTYKVFLCNTPKIQALSISRF